MENSAGESPPLPATAAGLTMGLGVFTTIGIWRGRPFVLDRHYARLSRDAAALELECPHSFDEIFAALSQVISANGITRGVARITLTARGDGRWNTETGSDLSVLAQPMTDIDRALKLGWSPYRAEARRAAAGVKSTSYADYLLAWREGQKRGLDEVILCNGAGALCEAARCNVMWTRGETLFTPALSTGCLPGIARALLLEWAREDGFETREAVFAPSELENADCVLLTNAASGARGGVLEGDVAREAGRLAEHLMGRWKEAVGA